MSRKFKPGEWVKVKGKLTAPKMQVLKYISRKDKLLGVIDNDTYLVCVWYKNGERKSAIFHQNNLIKTMDGNGLFITNTPTQKLRLT